MNRRNALVGLGGLALGGGALFGSGAFSQTEAQRSLEVNVIDDANISEDIVDVLIDAGAHDSVEVEEVDTGETTAGNLFPTSDSRVSLIANDVIIRFGPTDNELPPNSIVSYTDLVEIQNDDNSDGDVDDFDVEFQIDGTLAPDLEFDSNALPYTTTVTEGSTELINVDVLTDDNSDSDQLNIIITEN